jgi:2-amino-4-hydroxy-6-hydroxymethyldihydropteridine diphosphokinase
VARVYIGLGTNLGERRKNLERAKEKILNNHSISLIKESSIDETDPVDYLEQPKFLNQIILIETSTQPHELLRILKRIELQMGRTGGVSKGPRIIDLDILLYDDFINDSVELSIPHPGIKERHFILKHLLEIDPDLIDPLEKRRYRDIYSRLKGQAL